ncbi:hypothetical protein C9994_00090 [Marivirga lumbricoides]|uniref:Uncharacterized protein n=1 Tax=Marivirga lumbricoides TaxID=1046115 RepID=A0A2T4DW04_9BACT|nr:hypothetical protein C9994_00090 [Marivirga lumbricoides]
MIVSDITINETLRAISSEVLNGQNYNRGDFARSILNYPAMMVPSVQEPIIKSLSETFPGEVSLIDPFMGASNTLVTGMKYGLNVFGQDINPLSLLISQVKTSYYSLPELENARDLLKVRLDTDTSNFCEIQFHNIHKWFKEEVQVELSKIHQAICQEPTLKIRKFFWVALAEVVRLVSNDRTSTFKLHMRSLNEIQSRDLSAIDMFFSIVKRSIKDVNEYCSVLSKNGFIENDRYKKTAEVAWGDSHKKLNTTKKFNLLVTSPPYGDNQTTVTYGQFSFLPLQWIPSEDIDPDIEINYLKTTMEIDSNSLGGKMILNFLETQESLFKASPTLKSLFELFNDDEKKKAKKIINFFHDLDKSIEVMLTKLNEGAFMVWTIGNRNVNKRVVQNDLILIDLMRSKNIDLITDLERDILSKRMPCRNNFSDLMSKEKILIFKTPIG